jgi:hypothetical protein
VAKRDELRRQLGGVDARQLRHDQHVALRPRAARVTRARAHVKRAARAPATRVRTFFTRFSATCWNASLPSSTRADAAAVRCSQRVALSSVRARAQ